MSRLLVVYNWEYLNGENMKPIIVSTIAAAGLLVAGLALAVEAPAVGKAKCGACHAVEKKGVGPSYNDVSALYKGNKDAVRKITASITSGGSLGWGLGVMPPRGLGATDAEIKIMAEFIVGLASDAPKTASAAKGEAGKPAKKAHKKNKGTSNNSHFVAPA